MNLRGCGAKATPHMPPKAIARLVDGAQPLAHRFVNRGEPKTRWKSHFCLLTGGWMSKLDDAPTPFALDALGFRRGKKWT
jgi:hypothetical protein